jgi:PAS domain S-box-containing protein
MSTIQFKEVNCKNCYKCIRSCPVKAISFKDDHAQIIEESCILCGKCLKVCPQNAKTVKNDVDKVKGFIDRNLKVYASVAPSFVSAFDIKNERCISGLFKKLGFTYVEETAVGAEAVSIEYKKLLQEKSMTNIITTACPTIISLVEKYYGVLVDQLAPVVSPMIAHAKMLKEMYGPRIKVVFIGPCLSKKEEYKDSQNDTLIDAVITFEELEKWIKDEELTFNTEEDFNNKNINNIYSRFYPAPGGIIKSLGTVKKCGYNLMKFDGIDRCIEILDEIRDYNLKGYFIEMNSCAGGCLGGNCMNSSCGSYLMMREKLVCYVNRSSTGSCLLRSYDSKVDMFKKFYDRSKQDKVYEEEALEEVLKKIGKYSKEDEHNCGACGYSTCRDKAAAVLDKKADLHMCLPYMRERAESISNVIINSTPNAILAVAEDMQIQEVNLAAINMLSVKKDELQNKSIIDILHCEDIQKVKETGEDIFNRKYFYEDYDIIVEQSILYIKENHIIVIIMKDITTEEKNQQEIYKIRSENVIIAQKVIEKQMRIAQEIASLLGETTAETKVALTKLKNSIQAEMGEKV